MNIILVYSCFTTAYFAAFAFPPQPAFMIMEHIVFASFALDMIISSIRVRINTKNEDISHIKLLKAYVKSKEFWIDLLATFPFYLFQEMLKGNNNVVVIKLVRLFRIPVVLSYFSQFDVRTVSESLFSRESIGKQYAYKQTLYNISLVL